MNTLKIKSNLLKLRFLSHLNYFCPALQACVIMAPLLLKQLASSLTRQIAQMSRLNLAFSTPAAHAYRCVCSITTAPRALLRSSTRMPSVLLPSAQCQPSLLGQCQHLGCVQPSAGLKTKSAIKKRCKDCYFVRRRGHMCVYCKTNPRHKQRQG